MTATPDLPVNIPDTDWASLTLGEQIRHLEVEGFLVMKNMLSADQIAALRGEIDHRLKTRDSEPTPLKKVANDIQFAGGALTDLIAHPPTIAFLKAMFGDDVIMMTYDYARSEPGAPAINLHSDGQPWGSKIFGAEMSCPRLIRVLYYLQDLTPERAPFRVVPRSHLSFHAQGNPYQRYRSHPEQQMICCKAGDVVMINQNVFHGNYPNRTKEPREMLGIAYRPAWSGPCEKVDEWDPAQWNELPPTVKAVMGSRNSRVWMHDAPSVRPHMADEAPGINPSRWTQR